MIYKLFQCSRKRKRQRWLPTASWCLKKSCPTEHRTNSPLYSHRYHYHQQASGPNGLLGTWRVLEFFPQQSCLSGKTLWENLIVWEQTTFCTQLLSPGLPGQVHLNSLRFNCFIYKKKRGLGEKVLKPRRSVMFDCYSTSTWIKTF